MSVELEVFEEIVARLDASSTEYRVVDHAASKTSEQSAKLRGTLLEEGAKALLAEGASDFYVLVIPADQRLDLVKTREYLGEESLHLASENDLYMTTSLPKGALPPLGSLFKLRTVFDRSWESKVNAAFNAGSRERSVVMRAADLIRIEKPELADIVEQ